MRITVQTDTLETLKEAVESDCHAVRFGPEFCEWKIPSLDILKEAYEHAIGAGKKFTYNTPQASNSSLEKIREHLAFLDEEGRIDVVVNDLGTLNILEKYPELRPHLGRLLIIIPARCPWPQVTDAYVGFFDKRRVAKIFYQTSLNYIPTIHLFQEHGVKGVDVDFIPNSLPHYDFLLNNGLELSVHLHFTPVTFTRRCHTARFIDEKEPERCSKPCDSKAFLLKHNMLKEIDLLLCGNVVYRPTKASRKDVKKLHDKGVEIVISMNSATKIQSREEINALKKNYGSEGRI